MAECRPLSMRYSIARSEISLSTHLGIPRIFIFFPFFKKKKENWKIWKYNLPENIRKTIFIAMATKVGFNYGHLIIGN